MRKYTKSGRSSVRPSRKYTKINKDLSIRGGFAPRMPKNPTPPKVYKFVSQSLGNGPSAIPKGRTFVANMASAKAFLDVAGATIDVVSQARALGQSGNSTAVSTTKSSGIQNTTSTIGKKYRTKFDVGQPSTRTVNEKARANGTRKLVQYDTTVLDLDPVSANRKSLTMTTGANQKSIYAYDDRSYWTLGDLETLVDASAYTSSKNQSQNAYWMTKYFGTKVTLMNTNKYLKMRVKVNWLRPNQTSYDPKDWIADCVKATALPLPTDINKEWIPYNLQLTGAVNDPERFSVAIDPQLGSMRKSKLFDITFDTPKSFYKTLEPGEVWEIDYCHHTGPGVKLNDLIASENNATWPTTAAAFYYPMFELVGSPVEIVEGANTSTSFIATSSGAVQAEFKKYCEIVLANTSPSLLYVASGGYSKLRWDYRIFTDESTTDTAGTTISRRFNVDYTDILREGDPAVAGKYIIPVTTDLVKSRGGVNNDGT